METGAAIAVILCVLGTVALLGLPLTALVLRTAVSLFNRFAGSPKNPVPVPLPSLAKGMLIAFVDSVINVAVYVVAALATGGLSAYDVPNPQASFIAWLISAPISLTCPGGPARHAAAHDLLPRTAQHTLLCRTRRRGHDRNNDRHRTDSCDRGNCFLLWLNAALAYSNLSSVIGNSRMRFPVA